MRKKQFDNADCSRGSPIGRWECRDRVSRDKSIRVYRVRLDSGGYDDGGAYWGHGAPLYCLEQSECQRIDASGVIHYFRVFVRAHSKLEAIAEAEIPARMLARLPHKEYKKLHELHNAGRLSDRGVELLDKLNKLGFEAQNAN